MKQINLLEIIYKHIPTELYDQSLDKYYLSAMKEACETTVDLCSENAEITYYSERYSDPWQVNKESILKTKKQIV